MASEEKLEALKPCPFCGGAAEIVRCGNARLSTIYQCTECSCLLETGEEFNFGHRWNTRPSVAVGELREKIARIIEPYGFALKARRHLPERSADLCERAFNKADAILAALSSIPVGGLENRGSVVGSADALSALPRLPQAGSATPSDEFWREQGKDFDAAGAALSRQGFVSRQEKPLVAPPVATPAPERTESFHERLRRLVAAKDYPAALALLRAPASDEAPTTEDQITRMVDRFLAWRLPKPWRPDNGISFKEALYDGMSPENQAAHWPTGTNLFDATQATEMVRYMIEGVAIKPEADGEVSKATQSLQTTEPKDPVGGLEVAAADAVAGGEANQHSVSPPPAADGWIEWTGRENPAGKALVAWRNRQGDSHCCRADKLSGWNGVGPYGIVAYYVVPAYPSAAGQSLTGKSEDGSTPKNPSTPPSEAG